MQKTWFSLMWGAAGCEINGPFGDARADAEAFVRRELTERTGDADFPHEAGAVFALDLHPVDGVSFASE